ncbi:MAG: DUF1223 domain-containing protein [Acidobacteria bacterium]|nr:DUF1223 domain-containing protein [Acidobacteriota bacterium]
MKQFFAFAIFTLFVSFLAGVLQIKKAVAQVPTAQSTEAKSPTNPDKKAFVLLELYTSEGCPTCPPADANLAFLEKEQPFVQAEIVTLALHVDYWNSLAWKDRYSSPMFSRRQQIYSQALKTGSNYTPQMIVDGQTQFIGNNMAKTHKTILEAAKIQKATIEIAAAADKYKIKISDIPTHGNATVFLAITEDNLASSIKNGENSGEKPQHISVVRELKSLGFLTAEQKNLELETILQIQTAWKKENLKLVVFVQENFSRKVLGVSRIKL